MTSETLNLSSTHRIFDPQAQRPVTIFGVGSVGSRVADMFARKGVHDITVWDPSTVDSSNIPASLYRHKHDIGRPKVDALHDIILDATGIKIKTIERAYLGAERLRGTIISCVDDMDEGRCLIWPRVNNNLQVSLYCDSRIHSSYVEVYAVDPIHDDERTWYAATLFKNEDARRQMCGDHTDCLTASRAAEVIVAKTTRWWMHKEKGDWIFAERCDTLRRVF